MIRRLASLSMLALCLVALSVCVVVPAGPGWRGSAWVPAHYNGWHWVPGHWA
ncbi:MAG TPA: hypothetical protein VND19_07985 [Acetobacteraceae bacterium]|nr:hypothetical protein [Acetobacteraceae bacterium]